MLNAHPHFYSGTILKLDLRTPGQVVVRLGESIAQITPSPAPLVVKARVAAQDIGKVRLREKTPTKWTDLHLHSYL